MFYSITYREYLSLDEIDQEKLLWQRGEMLVQHNEKDAATALYQLAGFYIEVEYNLLQQRIAAFNIFEDGPKLDRYLATISLREIHSLLHRS